jgi:hypothetical protein
VACFKVLAVNSPGVIQGSCYLGQDLDISLKHHHYTSLLSISSLRR